MAADNTYQISKGDISCLLIFGAQDIVPEVYPTAILQKYSMSEAPQECSLTIGCLSSGSQVRSVDVKPIPLLHSLHSLARYIGGFIINKPRKKYYGKPTLKIIILLKALLVMNMSIYYYSTLLVYSIVLLARHPRDTERNS